MHVAPAVLHHARRTQRLHRLVLACAPCSRNSDALHFQATCLVTLLLVWSFTGSPQLLRPLLTSRSASSASPFQAQGEISPGKNTILHRTTAGFTTPRPRPQELRDLPPARPACASPRIRFLSIGSRFRFTLPLHDWSPFRSCASLRSLWSARGRTCTSKIVPMPGTRHKQSTGLFVSGLGYSSVCSISTWSTARTAVAS